MLRKCKFILLLAIPLVLSCSKSIQGYISYKEGNKYGYKNLSGKVVIPAQYDNVGWGNLNTYAGVQSGNYWGLIDRKGKLVLPIEYQYIEQNYEIDQNQNDGLIMVRKNDLYGFVDKTNKVIVPLVFSQIYFVENKKYFVGKKEGQWGIINLKNEILIPFEYDGLSLSTEEGDTIQASKNGLWGFINNKNEALIPFEFEDLGYYGWYEGLHAAMKNGKWGFIDHQGHAIIPFMYDRVSRFSEGLAFVEKRYLFEAGYIDHNNKTIIPFIYNGGDNSDFKNGIAHAIQNDKHGYIDKVGKVVIPLKYNNIGEFCNGYAWVEIRKKPVLKNGFMVDYADSLEGYIDLKGKEFLFPCIKKDSAIVQIPKAPQGLPDNTMYLKSWHSKSLRPWTMETVLDTTLIGLREEPKTYYDLCRIKEICIGYGMGITEGSYSERFEDPDRAGWQIFKIETIYKIIGSEQLRQTAWAWVAPLVKKTVQSMNPFHRQAYKDIAKYLKDYINRYDINKVKAYLARDEVNFAHKDMNGNYDPCRKLSAFVDRLIIVHKVISVKDAKIWINKIADEVETW